MIEESSTLQVGDMVKDGLGHFCVIIAGGPWQFQVQHVYETPQKRFVPSGRVFWVGRSEMFR